MCTDKNEERLSNEIKNGGETSNIPPENPAGKKAIKPTLKELAPQIIFSSMTLCIVIGSGINLTCSTAINEGLKNEADTFNIVNKDYESWIVTLATITVPIGSIISGPLMDRFGRKKVCFLSCSTAILSWILLLIAKSLTMIYIARVFSGIAAGLSNVGVVYISEITHPQIRAMLLCFNSIFVSFGVLLTYSFGTFLNWRIVAITFLVMECFVFFILFFPPESPHWLMFLSIEKCMDKRLEKVEESLKRLNPKENMFEREYGRITEIYEKQKSETKSKKNVLEVLRFYGKELSSPKAYKPILILATFFALQQLSGTYVVVIYAKSVFSELGGEFWSNANKNHALILFGVIKFVTSVATAFLSRIYKRRSLCIFSGTGMFLSMLISAILLFETSGSGIFATIANEKWFRLFIVLVYDCTSTLGFSVIPWTLIAEMLPTSLRAIFGGFLVSFAYIMMTGALKAYPDAIEYAGAQNVFFFFSIMSLVATIFIYVFVPETLGKSLAEVEDYFSRSRSRKLFFPVGKKVLRYRERGSGNNNGTIRC